jgi:transcriptional regulator with XRE-family HTH domain
MKITAITKYKHGGLYNILQKLGWTQAELSRRSGVNPTAVGEIINLTKRPSVQQANSIQIAFGDVGEYFDVLEEWPATFNGCGGLKHVVTKDIPTEQLLGNHEAMNLPAPEMTVDYGRKEKLELVLETLTRKEAWVLRERFYGGKTLQEVGDQFDVTGNRVRMIEAKALRKMRHPERIRLLEGLIKTPMDVRI